MKFICLFVAAAALTAQVPTLVEATTPEYSEEALRAELEGIVMVSAVVGADGYAHDLRIARPLGLGLDEKALEAVRMWRVNPAAVKGVAAPMPARIPVPFLLPSKSSRWHLVRADFKTPEGGERAQFLSTNYPTGAGISTDSYEQGSLVVAMGRQSTTTVSFDIDAQGVPSNFVVEEQSEKVWGKEAAAVVSTWRFTPAKANGAAVASRGSVMMAWGRRTLDAATLAQLLHEPRAGTTTAGLIGEYSEEAARARIEGVVQVAFVLDAEGKASNARVVRGLGYGLDEKALEAVSKFQLRFNGQSPKVDGVEQTLDVQFRITEVQRRR